MGALQTTITNKLQSHKTPRRTITMLTKTGQTKRSTYFMVSFTPSIKAGWKSGE